MALESLDFIHEGDNVHVVLMIFLEDLAEECLHLQVEDNDMKIWAPLSTSMPRVRNPIGYLDLDFRIKVNMVVISGRDF